MKRTTARLLAVLVLALLGAPVALHVVVHDLAGHHDDHHDEVAMISALHGDHEHPVVGAASSAAARVIRATLPLADPARSQPMAAIRAANADRNVVAFGALRTDDDVGLHTLLSTFLI